MEPRSQAAAGQRIRPSHRESMDSKVFCVYNLARGVSLSSKVTVADNANQPLKILNIMVSGFALTGDSGLWLTQLIGPPAVPRLFPFDLVYLDKDHRILNMVELLPGVAFPPYSAEVSSALVLPLHMVESTHTATGDRLIICVAEEMDRLLGAIGTTTGKAAKAGEAGSAAKAKSPAAPGPVLPLATFPWIKFSDQGGPAEAIASEKNPVSAQQIAEIASKIAEKRPGNGQQKAKSAAIPAETAIGSRSRVSESRPARPLNGDKRPSIPREGAKEGKATAAQAAAVQPQPAGEVASAAPVASAAKTTKKPVPTVSITEVVVEGPKDVTPQRGVGTEDGADLFANWVVSPSIAPEWIEQKTDPFIKRRESPAAKKAGTEATKLPTEISALRPDAGSAPREVVFESAAPKIDRPEPDAGVKETASPAPIEVAAESSTAKPAARSDNAPKAVLNAGPIAIRPASQTTSFTVAQYGLWHVSQPTGLGPVVTGNAPAKPATIAAGPAMDRGGQKATRNSSKQEEPTGSPEKGAVADNQRAASEAALIREALKTIPSAAAGVRKQVLQELPGLSEAAKLVTDKAGVAEPRDEGAAKTAALREAVQATEERTQQTPPVMKEAPAAVERVTVPGKARTQWSSPESSAAKNEAPNKTTAEVAAKISAPLSLKAETEPRGLATRFKRWLNPVSTPKDRRRAHRRYVPGMVAHYYTGGAPRPHEVADISMSGFYVVTEDRWMPDTMIQMTLQKPCANGERKQSITVLSRIVRRGSDGVAVEFVMPESLDAYGHDVHPSQTTDKFALARFL